MKQLRTAWFAVLLVVVAGIASLSFNEGPQEVEPISALCRDQDLALAAGAPSMPNWRTDPNVFIAHSGGSIDGFTYTNSLEAVESSIRRGYKMIELDLQITTDGFLVAAHDWTTFKKRSGLGPDAISEKPMSLAQFKSNSIDGRYTPLDEDMIRTVFLRHPELILVTDKIADFPRLAKAFPFQERVIVEVFSPQDVAAAKASGISNPMLSIGNLEASLPMILQLPVRHVALSINSLRRCPGAAKRIVESGRKVFLFTTDDAALMARSVGSHVSAFYSDYWHVRHGRCEGPACPNKTEAAADGR